MAQTQMLFFRIVQALIGFIIAYVSLRIYSSSQPRGWRFLHYSGIVIYLWSLLSVVAYFLETSIAYAIDGIGIPLFATMLALSGITFIARDFPLDVPDVVSFRNTLVYCEVVLMLALLVGILTQQFTSAVFTILHASALLLILPGIYGFFKIPRWYESFSWSSILFATLLTLIGVASDIYATAVCGAGSTITTQACSSYGYMFPAVFQPPVNDTLLSVALNGPVFLLFAMFSFGIGVVSFYQTIFQQTRQGKDAGSEIEALVQGTMDNVGSIIGESLAQRIVENTFRRDELAGVTLEFRDGEPHIIFDEDADPTNLFEPCKDALIDQFENTTGPVARRKIAEVADQIRADDGDVSERS